MSTFILKDILTIFEHTELNRYKCIDLYNPFTLIKCELGGHGHTEKQ